MPNYYELLWDLSLTVYQKFINGLSGGLIFNIGTQTVSFHAHRHG